MTRRSGSCSHEGDDVRPPGGLAGQFESGLDSVRPGRAGELDPVVEATRQQYARFELLEERGLGGGVQIESVGESVGQQVVDDGLLDAIVIVPVVECAGTGEEVDVGAAVLIEHQRALGPAEGGGERSAVGAHVRFQPVEDRLSLSRMRHGAGGWGSGCVQRDYHDLPGRECFSDLPEDRTYEYRTSARVRMKFSGLGRDLVAGGHSGGCYRLSAARPTAACAASGPRRPIDSVGNPRRIGVHVSGVSARTSTPRVSSSSRKWGRWSVAPVRRSCSTTTV